MSTSPNTNSPTTDRLRRENARLRQERNDALRVARRLVERLRGCRWEDALEDGVRVVRLLDDGT